MSKKTWKYLDFLNLETLALRDCNGKIKGGIGSIIARVRSLHIIRTIQLYYQLYMF